MITWRIREFVDRDWSAVRQAKDEYWFARIAKLGPLEGFRIAEELRLQALLHDPSWPRPEERHEDLLSHVRLAGIYHRAGSASRG